MKSISYETCEIDYEHIRGKEVFDYFNANCFADISNPHSNLLNKDKVLVHIRKSCTPYEDKEVQKWIDLLNDNKFYCKLIDLEGKKKSKYDFRYYEGLDTELKENGGYIHVYTIEVKLNKFINKTHFLSTLYLIRYLQEDDLYEFPEKIMKAVDKGIDFITSVYLMNYIDTQGGHNIITGEYAPKSLPTVKEFWKAIKEDGNKINKQKTSTQQVWSCESIDPYNDYKKAADLFETRKYKELKKLLTEKEKIKEKCIY